MTSPQDLTGLASLEMPGGVSATAVAAASLRPADTPRLGGENLDHGKALAEVGDCWPPILVHPQTMRVIDGMHRARAARPRGQTTNQVPFFDCYAWQAFVTA